MRNAHPASGPKARDYEENLLAYVSSHNFFGFESEWRAREGGSRVAAAFHSKNDPGHVHPSTESSQKGCSEQGGKHDQAKGKLYRRCTADFA